MNVPLLDLKAQFATIEPEVMAALKAVIDSHQYINGPAVAELEKQIAAYSGCKAGVGVASGTDVLLCSLMALGIAPGDEVITTPYTFFATAGCIWRVGARPVFADIDPQTFNIDPTAVAAAITPRTKAIMPVHLFGQMADMEAIMGIARAHNLHVIEDAAQAIGAARHGCRAGSVGTAGCFSFFPSKNLGGMGDGGMVVTQDAELAERIAVFRNHGMKPKYFHRWVGGNFRLDTLQAAALVVKLRHLDGWSAQRRKNAQRYDQLFAGCDQVRIPRVAAGNVSIYNQYVIRVPRRDELVAFLRGQGIGTDIYYPLSLHQQECFAPLGYKKGDFPASEEAAATSLALPIYPELTDEQIRYVAHKVVEFLA